MAFRKALIERALGAQLPHHLGWSPGDARPQEEANHRNGRTDNRPVRIVVPRDRASSFEPLHIAKHEWRFTGSDNKIVAICARGMAVFEIQAFLADQYGTEVGTDFISSVTAAVMSEVGALQVRPQR